MSELTAKRVTSRTLRAMLPCQFIRLLLDTIRYSRSITSILVMYISYQFISPPFTLLPISLLFMSIALPPLPAPSFSGFLAVPSLPLSNI